MLEHPHHGPLAGRSISKDPPKRGRYPYTDTPAEPRDNILVIQRNFFTVGQDLPRDLIEHHVHNVKGGIVQLLIDTERAIYLRPA